MVFKTGKGKSGKAVSFYGQRKGTGVLYTENKTFAVDMHSRYFSCRRPVYIRAPAARNKRK